MVQQYKVDYINKLADEIKDKSMIFCDFKGISVADITVLREKLRSNNSSFRIVKNTLFKLTAKQIEMDIDESIFKEPTAVTIINENFSESAKIISEEEKSKKLTVKGGIFNKNIISSDEVKKIASIPPKDVLLSYLVQAIQSPITGLVYSLQGIINDAVYTLQAIEEQKK